MPAAPLFNTSATLHTNTVALPMLLLSAYRFSRSSCHGHCQRPLDIQSRLASPRPRLPARRLDKHQARRLVFQVPPQHNKRHASKPTQGETCVCLPTVELWQMLFAKNSDNYPKNNTPRHWQASAQTWGRNLFRVIALLKTATEVKPTRLYANNQNCEKPDLCRACG